MYRLLNCQSILFGQSLLYLKPATERLGDTSELGKAEDQLAGNVCNRNLYIVEILLRLRDRAGAQGRGTNLASERNEVVFAEAGNLDVPDENHLVVILLEDSIVYDV